MRFREDLDLKVFDNRFQDILKIKRNYQGPYPLMDFGIGEEKDMPDPRIISALELSLIHARNHKYTDRGILELKKGIKDYLKSEFRLDVVENEIAITMGTKEGLAILPSFLIKPGDIVISTTPGYVVLEQSARLYNAEIIHLPLKAENNFLPDLSSVDEKTWQKVKIFSVNYPNNPTGAVASVDFYRQVIKKAQQYHFLIVNDAAYLSYTYEEEPLSILSVEGAKEVAIELYTLSKSHNMTGYRIGFMVGNPEVISKYTLICDIFDSGQYAPIEYAACYALKHHDITWRLKNKYRVRMENIVDILNDNGFEAHMSPGTYYLYVKVPRRFKNAHECANYLLTNLGIMTIPYDECGSFIRLSMTYVCERELEFYLSFDKRLKNIK